MTTNDLRRLFEHMWWADARVEQTLTGLEAPPPATLELHAHVLGAELVWLDRIQGAASDAEVWPAGDATVVRELARRAREGYEKLLVGLDEDDLARPVAYRNSAGRSFETRVDDILFHVALHGAYHRGQISNRLREAGIDPSPTDYIAYVRGAPSATRRDTDPSR